MASFIRRLFGGSSRSQPAPAPAPKAPAAPAKGTEGPGGPGTGDTAAKVGAGRTYKPARQKTKFTGALGISVAERSNRILKTLTGE